jgi:ferrous iron transport protein B
MNLRTPISNTARTTSSSPQIAIVGCPNVGKSVLFHRLTGTYVTVSNYPGTTVEVTRGHWRLAGTDVEVIDTPGMYSLKPISEEEAVARRLLLEETPGAVLHVVDARNLQRMLPMTLQLLEAGFRVVLALNILDEAERLGFAFEPVTLADALGIPVVGTVGASSRGLEELQQMLLTGVSAPTTRSSPTSPVRYEPAIEEAIETLTPLLGDGLPLTPRALALLLLQGDTEIEALIAARAPEALAPARACMTALQARYAQPVSVLIALRRQAVANDLVERGMHTPSVVAPAKLEWLSRLLMQPLTGLPIVAAVLYFAIYQFVGVFGGGTVVDFLETRVFGAWLNPWVTQLVQHWVPNPLWWNLFVGEYGLITLGLTYAVAIVLPIVGLFFFVFAFMEDSGYLPRLAMLIDRLCKVIGLNGRAVIPLVLGFGCDTMATMVTRVLETRRERIIATLLLALAIPCAAQSGLFLAMVSAVRPFGLLIYLGILMLIFVAVGMLAARVIPGERAHFYMELPPLRLPDVGNVLVKTYTRLEWYFLEILPMFLLASAILWLGSLTWTGQALAFSPHQGLLGNLERALDPLAVLIGLPTTADVARTPALQFSGGTILLAGFFRRDFGAAGLWHLFTAGLLSPVQVLTASVTLTLFLPCVAQFLVMKKERGWPATLAMTAVILVVAFGMGWLIRVGLGAAQAAGFPLVLTGEGVHP